MKRCIKNILFCSGMLLAGTATLSAACYIASGSLLRVAMDRKQPVDMEKGKRKVAKIRWNPTYEAKAAEASERLANKPSEEVSIMSHDGLRLVGHWIPREGAKRIIIAMHGWRSCWHRDFGTIADFLFHNECSVLFPEQRGQNKSDGEYMGFGMLERHDCLDWIQWVNKQVENKIPIYLVGISMGAATVLMAAGLNLPENVHGIIADCGFTSPQEIWQYVSEKNLHLPYKIQSVFVNDMCKKRIHMGANDYSAIDAMKRCRVPVLFIHGTEDHFVPVEMTYENYKACRAPKHLFIVPGADHAMCYYEDKEGYENSVLQFWKTYDKEIPPYKKNL